MASAHFAELRAFAETLSHEELIQQLVTMEGHKTENKKISQQRDRLLRKNKRQAKEIEELKADKKKFFDEVVEACQCDADTEDEVVSIITDMESEFDPEMMRELKELMKDYESVIPDDYDTATPDDIKKVIEDQFQKGYDKGALENSVDTEFLEEKEAEIEVLKEEFEDGIQAVADNLMGEGEDADALCLTPFAPKMIAEIEKLKADKKKVFYYDGFLTKMFDEDENGEWSEWTDFVEKQSFEDGKKLFGFEGDSDEE